MRNDNVDTGNANGTEAVDLGMIWCSSKLLYTDLVLLVM